MATTRAKNRPTLTRIVVAKVAQLAWRFVLTRPFIALIMLIVALIWQGWGVVAVVALAGAAAAACFAAAWWWPTRWARFVAIVRLRTRRRMLIASWPLLCMRLHLEMRDPMPDGGLPQVSRPRLTRVRRARPAVTVLRARVEVLPGQVTADVTDHADRIATAIGARWCRPEQIAPGVVELRFLFGDELAVPVPLHTVPIASTPDLSALHLGITETGDPWCLGLTGGQPHLLIAGATSAGKASYLWGLLRALAPLIRSGVVRVWGIDLKGGMELAWARPLLHKLATTIEEAGDVLAQLAELTDARAASMAGVSRQHVPSVAEPLELLIIDELAALTAYDTDRQRRDKNIRLTGSITTKGRAPGVHCVAAVQDPRKETCPRHLFPARIALRLDSADQPDMVLGQGSRAAGALADKIPASQPGVAYVMVDGDPVPVRVRVPHVDDDTIRQLVRQYRPNSSPADVVVRMARAELQDDVHGLPDAA